MLAVILEVRLRPEKIGDLLLGSRRDRLIDLEFRDGWLTRSGNVIREVLVAIGHGDSLRSSTRTAYAAIEARARAVSPAETSRPGGSISAE